MSKHKLEQRGARDQGEVPASGKLDLVVDGYREGVKREDGKT